MPELLDELPPPTIGQRIAQLRRQAGISQVQLLRRLGWKHNHGARISQYEIGLKIPKFKQLKRIAAALGVGLEEFNDCVER